MNQQINFKIIIVILLSITLGACSQSKKLTLTQQGIPACFYDSSTQILNGIESAKTENIECAESPSKRAEKFYGVDMSKCRTSTYSAQFKNTTKTQTRILCPDENGRFIPLDYFIDYRM